MPDEEPNGPFAGLVSAVAIALIVAAIGAVALCVGIGSGSWLAGVLAFAAMMLMSWVAIWKAPGMPED